MLLTTLAVSVGGMNKGGIEMLCEKEIRQIQSISEALPLELKLKLRSCLVPIIMYLEEHTKCYKPKQNLSEFIESYEKAKESKHKPYTEGD